MGTLFAEIRQRVTAEDAARLYGMQVNRHGNALCPWHEDRHPSLKFYRNSGRCYCFACHNGGSAIDLTARLLGITPIEAAQRLNADFRLNLADAAPARPAPPIGETDSQRRQRERAALAAEYSTACDRLHGLSDFLSIFTPEAAENNPAFDTALARMAQNQTKADELLEILNERA